MMEEIPGFSIDDIHTEGYQTRDPKTPEHSGDEISIPECSGVVGLKERETW